MIINAKIDGTIVLIIVFDVDIISIIGVRFEQSFIVVK